MEGLEAISNLFRVFFPKNIGRADPGLITGPAEGYVTPPRIIPAEKIQARTPPTPCHLHPPGLHRYWRGDSAVSRSRSEFLLQMGIQMIGSIRHPNVEGGEGEDVLEVQEEGGQGVLSKGDPELPSPDASIGVEGSDGFLRKKGNQCVSLSAPIGPIAGLQFRIP
jgi:hypothetical protein